MTSSLASLSNNEVNSHLLGLRDKEKEVLHQLLLALVEVDKRSLYLEVGYPSLFAYCREKLGYSELVSLRAKRSNL